MAAGGIFEAVWASTLNLSDGFTNIPWAVVTVVISFVSIAFLYYGLRLGAPVGGAYAVWTGCGTVCSTLSGLLFFGQTLSLAGCFFMAVLVGGVLLMQSSEGSSKSQRVQ